ncbi:MAG: hypothetical protein ABMA64_18165 [Myxococcota bacterium]
MWLLWTGSPALAGAAEDDIARAIASCSGARYPLPPLSADQRAQLARGEVVKIVHQADDPQAPSTATGIAVLDHDRPHLWLAAQDPHASVDESLVEFVIESLGPDHALWYGHMDLPRPITDRQWVVESTNNHGLGEACWEHRWKLVEGALDRVIPLVEAGGKRVTRAQLDEAIYTPVNQGNWLMAPLADGRTLISYQATSVVGGSIPDWLVLQLTMARLDSVFQSVSDRATSWVPGHYGPAHPPVYGGDGRPIPQQALAGRGQ